MEDPLSPHRERFAADPDAAASFELLEEQCFLAGQWAELAEIYQLRIAAPGLAKDAPQRARLLLRLAKILEERLEQAEGAVQAYSESARLDPKPRKAWQALRRLYGERGSWDTVLQVAELEIDQIQETAERASLLRLMGEIWEQQLGDAEQAEQLYARARSEDAGANPDEQPDEQVAAVARVEPDEAAAAVARVEPDEEPAQVARREPDEEAEDHSTLVQSAWISAARGDSHAAVTGLRRALDIDPANVEAIDMLVTVLEGAERHGEMAEMLERRAALAIDAVTRAAVLSRLGLVREAQLGDLGGARSAYERALSADARNQGAQLALIRIYRLTEGWGELRELLEMVSAEGPPDQRVGAACQLGLLLERQFGDVEAAECAFEEALALEPDNVEARAALMRLRDAGEEQDTESDEEAPREHRAVRVVGVLERKLERLEEAGSAPSDENSVKLRLRLAELRSSTLDDPVGAIAVLEPCLEDEDALLMVAQRLALLYESAGRSEPVISLARRAAAASLDPTDRAEWNRRAAETARAVGESDVAVEFYGRLLEDRPGDRHAERALLELHRTRGEALPLVDLLRSELARASKRDELSLHVELAELFSGSLDDPAAALAHWRRALTLDPTHQTALEEGLRCADRIGGALEQLDLIEHVTAVASTDEDRARILVQRGDLLASALGWSDEGAESWRQSLVLDPDQPDARSRLESQASAPT